LVGLTCLPVTRSVPSVLTQGIAKQMVKRGGGRIVWVSSREGLNTNPFTGIYSASKHAVEAIAETMSLELREFGIEVATINPGPFLTGFNDRGFETWLSWDDDASERLFDYSRCLTRNTDRPNCPTP
jgi:short-subunit dehydrogenase